MANQSNRTRRAEIDGRGVYIKRYLPRQNRSMEDIRHRMQREADLLRHQEQIGALSRGLGALRLVAADTASCTITTAEVDGQPLEAYLERDFRVRAGIRSRRALWLAGRWLQHFHDLEVRPLPEAFSSDGFLDYCAERLEVLARTASPWLHARERAGIMTATARLLSRTEATGQRMAWCHGDYAPFNVFWDGQTLTPIDFEMSKPALAMTDVTYFVHRMEMLQIYRPWKKWPIPQWRRAFLRGYGNEHLAESPMFRACMVRHLICRLLSMDRLPSGGALRVLHNRWVRHQIRRSLIHLVRVAG